MQRIPGSLSWSLTAIAVLLLATCGSSTDDDADSLDLSERLPAGEVRAGVVEKAEDLIGGLKAEGREGDIKMYNSRAEFIIEGVRPASGFRHHGGNLVDADIVRPEGEEGRDLYGESFFTWNLELFEPLEVEIVSDGQNGQAHARFTGRTSYFAFGEDLLGVFIDPPRPGFEVTYDYRLGPNDEALRLRVTLTNPGEERVPVEYPFIAVSHGDGAHFFASRKGFAASGTVGSVPFIAAAGTDLAYGMMAMTDDLSSMFEYQDLVLFTAEPFDVFPGQSAIFDYFFVVTEQSVAGLQEARRRLVRDHPTGTIEGSVSLPATACPSTAWISIQDGEDVVTITPVTETGSFDVDVPPGNYQVHPFARSHAAGRPAEVTVAAGDSVSASLELEAGARITSTVSTPDDAPLNARVTFFRLGDTPTPFAPDTVRPGDAWHDNVSGAAYVLEEPATIVLPAGEYRAVATRGPSWEMDEIEVEVTPGQEKSLSFVIKEAVDTEGWVSSDMHMHAYLSFDSHVPFETRVKQAATDALDVPLLSEHVWAGGLQETAVEMGLDDVVIGIAGQEVTTFLYGHFNVFPLVPDPDLPNNGGVFEHGQSPSELFANMRAQHPGDTVIMINHPRSGPNLSSYFNYVGLDAEADTVRHDDEWVLDWELVEVFNRSCGGDTNRQVLEDWIGLTNHGHRKGIAATTDSHHENRVPGLPRTWIQMDKELLRADHQELVAPLRDRRSFVSCGPFVRFEAEDGTGLGGMTTVDEEGKVRFNVKVEAPTWMRLDEVRLLENGETIESIDVTDRNGEVVRFDGILEARPAGDAWYVVKAIGSGSLAPVSWEGSPYAITNPIEVDADGDGVWTPPAHQEDR